MEGWVTAAHAGITAAPLRETGRDPAGITPVLPDWVVPLQPLGAGTPVFVFPTGHHEAGALATDARIAALVGQRHPFWGLRRDDPHFARVRAEGVPAMVTPWVEQMRAIRGAGPFLLFGNCAGGYFAWETARQLLAAGDEIAGMLFYEVPLRSDIDTASPRRLTDLYRPEPLPVGLTLLMTGFWAERGWSDPWRRVALGAVETVVIAGETEGGPADREARIARYVRAWIEQAEARVRGA